MRYYGPILRAAFFAGIAKIALGVLVTFALPASGGVSPAVLPASYYLSFGLIFGLSGTILHFGGGRDANARSLAVVFALFGTFFADRMFQRVAPPGTGSLGAAFALVAAIHPIAFEPLALWEFAWGFPRSPLVSGSAWFAPAMRRIAVAAGVLLMAGTLAASMPGLLGTAWGHLGTWLTPDADNGWFWSTVSLLQVPPLVLMAVKLRTAGRDERRRLSLVVLGLVAGSLPLAIHVLLFVAFPRYAEFTQSPAGRPQLAMLLSAIALVIPASTAYAVLVDQALEIHLVVRRAVQYALARYTVLCLMAAFVIGLFVEAYRNRSQTLQELLGGSPGALAGLVLTLLLLRSRRSLLSAIDRRFFREQYDARQVLSELAVRSGRAESARDVMALITAGVDRALHVERVALLVRSADGGRLRDPAGLVRDLETTGPLTQLVGGARVPLDVDLSSESSALARLPEREREWLADAHARLVVPFFGARDALIGLLLLGDKRSELPFTREDRMLLTAVAASAMHSLEQKLLSESGEPDRPLSEAQDAAAQCEACGGVQERRADGCRTCGGRLDDALLPCVLAGKFRTERRIGAGGMGVVYLARDLTLDRPVALKVLPRVGSSASARLRREARVMAVLQHPNLAVIHAMESWRGAPVLVLEYLAGGTLADRIRSGPMAVDEVVSVGETIAGVLHHVHRAGLLHRDIKPSNIGFTGESTAKLLDFGLVRLVSNFSDASTLSNDSTSSAAPWAADARTRPSPRNRMSEQSSALHIAGTLPYLSPEALRLTAPDHRFDLWSLAVTLYEAIAGTNPFQAPTAEETRNRIIAASPPELCAVRPDCPRALADFFATALSSEPAGRPRNAASFLRGLRAAHDSPA